jgi:cellulose synthase (UDP-forming)
LDVGKVSPADPARAGTGGVHGRQYRSRDPAPSVPPIDATVIDAFDATVIDRLDATTVDRFDATAVDNFQPVTTQPAPPARHRGSERLSPPATREQGRHRRSQVSVPVNAVHAPLTRSDLVRLPAEAGPGLVLPVPPSDDEKYSYVRRHNWILTVCAALTFPPLLYSQVRMFDDSLWFVIYVPFIVLGAATWLLSLISDGMSRDFDLVAHKKFVANWMPLWNPSVDVFLPICGEPVELLRNTWTYVAALRASYNGKLTPYVLDDGASPAAKALAKELGFAYATRPDRGWYKKSGNLRYGFEISDGEFILLLDADFAPRADLLDEALPYFALFPDVGIVQTPQYFHVLDRQTWVERGAGATQELFYRSIQTARDKRDSAVCVGSCAVYRREALRANGGMSLAEHSEDLHTGFDLSMRGWRMQYLPIALSTGICPDNILAFLNQQYRWCSGTFSLLGAKRFWNAQLPLSSRLTYLAGLVYYIYTAAYTFAGPALAIAMLVFTPQLFLFKNLVFVAPVLFYVGVVYPMWHKLPYRLEAWSVRLLAGWSHAFALWDMMRGQLRGWQPSGTGAKKQDGRRRLWLGLLGWSFTTAFLWALLGLWRMMTMDAYNFCLIFALGVFQLMVMGRILIQPRDMS